MTSTPHTGAPDIIPSERFPFAIDGNVFGWSSGVEATTETLDAFHDAGGRLISTADHYAGGRSEIMIGNWVRSRSARSSVFLATKIGRHPDAPGLSRVSICKATEASLERLQTDHIDLLVFDGDQLQSSLEDSLRVGGDLIAAGKVGAIAASSFSTQRLFEARKICETEDLPGFRAVFSPYSLMKRHPVESDLGPTARSLGVGIFARLPLAEGFLTGEYRSRADVPESAMFDGAAEHIGRRGFSVLKALQNIADEIEESLASCALAWVRSKPGIIGSVVRAGSAGQISSIALSAGLVLEPRQIEELDRASQ